MIAHLQWIILNTEAYFLLVWRKSNGKRRQFPNTRQIVSALLKSGIFLLDTLRMATFHTFQNIHLKVLWGLSKIVTQGLVLNTAGFPPVLLLPFRKRLHAWPNVKKGITADVCNVFSLLENNGWIVSITNLPCTKGTEKVRFKAICSNW